MITEDYVSFEIAKLLKEKGFDEKLQHYYDTDGILVRCRRGVYFSNKSNAFIAPTIQMAMKWLREIHKIFIDISPTYDEVEKTIHFIWQIFDSNYDVVGDCEIFYGKYETACEAALKYSLENLI